MTRVTTIAMAGCMVVSFVDFSVLADGFVEGLGCWWIVGGGIWMVGAREVVNIAGYCVCGDEVHKCDGVFPQKCDLGRDVHLLHLASPGFTWLHLASPDAPRKAWEKEL